VFPVVFIAALILGFCRSEIIYICIYLRGLFRSAGGTGSGTEPTCAWALINLAAIVRVLIIRYSNTLDGNGTDIAAETFSRQNFQPSQPEDFNTD